MCRLSVWHLSFSKCIRKANGLGTPVKKLGSLTVIYYILHLGRFKVQVIVPAVQLLYYILGSTR